MKKCLKMKSVSVRRKEKNGKDNAEAKNKGNIETSTRRRVRNRRTVKLSRLVKITLNKKIYTILENGYTPEDFVVERVVLC